MGISDDERTQGYWCAYHHVKKHGIRSAREFAEDTPDDEPWWQGFKEYLEEVSK